jgi:hypothetical protein
MLAWEKLYTSYEDGIRYITSFGSGVIIGFHPAWHGSSLSTLYRRAAERPGPSLLFVRDTQGGVRCLVRLATALSLLICMHHTPSTFITTYHVFVRFLEPT